MSLYPLTLHAVWDTGAPETVIAERIAMRLKLEQGSNILVTSPYAEDHLSHRYFLSFSIGQDLHFARWIAAMPMQSYDMIIGMDIITKGVCTIRPIDNGMRMTFEYKPHNVLDEEECKIFLPQL